ncbi:deoxyribose-phosphate aldolase [Porphyromonas gingivalis W4087]|uniref:Deoxyribose-phosphate aldolase n=2 Tax=Porphyromonas gingivalis TaxID=837 RepID=A0A0E2LR29_PORGN|nr:deoxyribose-phosphate aldolase [Porphyromonas gingivalis]ERJ67018.1 deoxyribose-phosphate aldolase [Porphyromonas gingivalis F0570]ERJ89073.1 deoxyribose-phosphate aldolase [Porphyromonas gingivalis W4087]PDP61755.1 deoxyribose-phosphate aldolase [Porphyromonas gingivalis]PDP74679.1 deoxyribose-phosphate aldolase [Porphyromonas gingivalis]WCF98928.1 deoxyribose-phosphate aldolase [Porphyromonas gingivalis]
MAANKYEMAFAQFDPAESEERILLKTDQIIRDHYSRFDTPETKKFLHGIIDLTSLNATDSEESITKFTESVNDFEDTDPTIPSVAAICVYPNFVSTVRETLTAENVKVASVSGCFPASQSFIEVKLAETALAVSDGADEIDIVLNIGKFLSGDYEAAATEIEEQIAAAKGATVKVILETGALKTPENIRRATILSLFCGAHFVKTSTGKGYPGASLEAAYTMCKVLKQYYGLFGEVRGIKLSGGIRTTEDAVKYYCLIETLLGKEWLTPAYFRIGASSLVDALRQDIMV